MLMQRVVTGVILLILVLQSLFNASFQFFVFLVSLVTLVAGWEWSKLIGIKQYFYRMCYVWCVAISICVFWWYAPPYPHWLGFVTSANWQVQASFFILLFSSVWWFLAVPLVLTYPSKTFRWCYSPWTIGLIGLVNLLAFWVALIAIRGLNMLSDTQFGATLILHWMSIIWAADVGAYFAGKRFGRIKLAPKVSPNKTWEGVFGGMITAACVAGLGWLLLPEVYQSVLQIALVSSVLVFFSVIGDLTESVLKRERNLKDSGRILPGHGGLLDRIDSLLSTSPIFALAMIIVGLMR
ncbi:MAG: phosphatidate cytidylyltransferase [Pseudomonadota bacterium]